METVLATDNLTKRYRNRAVVDGLSLTVRQGDIYGFLGANGAGKTTTLRMIMGLIRPSAGRIELMGHDIARSPRTLMAQVGCVIESPAYYGELSAAENLRLVQKLKRSHIKHEVPDLLELVGLTDVGSKRVRDFSLGMRQRLAIAQALVGRPQLLVLDEPSNGMDPAGLKEMRDLIRRLVSEHGLTIMLSSHLLHEVEQVATRLGMIREGRLVADVGIHELRCSVQATLELEVDRPREAAALLAERYGLTSAMSPEGCLLIHGDPSPADVAELLVTHGFRLSHLSRAASDLEAYFLAMTGGAERV